MYLSLTLSRCSNTSVKRLLIILPNTQTQFRAIHQLHSAVHAFHLPHRGKLSILVQFAFEAWTELNPWDFPVLSFRGPVSSVPCFSLSLLSPSLRWAMSLLRKVLKGDGDGDDGDCDSDDDNKGQVCSLHTCQEQFPPGCRCLGAKCPKLES